MKPLTRSTAQNTKPYPVKIIQFGEGNFLRAFFDWMVDQMNKKIDFNTGIAVVQPIEQGLANILHGQGGLYHLYLQGIKDGQPVSDVSLIDAIQRALNPYTQYDDYLNLIDNPDLRFLVSNTTESGIAYLETDQPDMTPQKSFPAKVTALLYRRFQIFNGSIDKGLIIFCCELIDRNADKLKEYVLKYAQSWQLPADFTDWINNANTFCNTLVDRIVPGYPKDKINDIQKSLGFQDQLVVEGEYFHVWVIEAPGRVKKEFPAQDAGLNVIFTDDLTPYRELKVRILNGAHTASFAVSLLSGIETVKESIEHPQVGRFMRETIFEEVCPNIKLTGIDPVSYAEGILERFFNPYIKHFWKSIALNSVSKWQTRVLPSLIDYHTRTNNLPPRLVFSLAALISYYRGKHNGNIIRIDDSREIIDFFQSAWAGFSENNKASLGVAEKVLANTEFWKMQLNDIPGLRELLATYILDIQKSGMASALSRLLDSN
jgi:tagaturonate reductase